MTSAPNTVMIADTPTARPSRHCTLISSESVTEYLARRSSARMMAEITVSISQPSMARTAITAKAIQAEPVRYLRERAEEDATQATATSRADMPVIPARRPAAMCGSEPSAMPTAATITTWSAGPPFTGTCRSAARRSCRTIA